METGSPFRRRTWALRLVAVVAIIASLALDRSPLVIVAFLFVAVVPFEKLFPRHDQRLRRPQLGLDLTYALSQPVMGFVTLLAGFTAAIVSLAWMPGLLVRPAVAALDPTMKVIVAFLVFDFIIYWVHRWSHEVPFLWRFHAIHHSIETMDWISAFRNHPIDGLIIAPAVAFMLAAGFSVEVTGALAVVQIATGIFLHANVRWRLRRLERVIITPEFHHWHHANEPDAVNSNYSIFLPLWDIAFGTWYMPPDRRPQRYGVDEDVPRGLAMQLAYPFAGLRSPLAVLRHPRRKARHLTTAIARGLVQVRSSALRPRRPFPTPPRSESTSVGRAHEHPGWSKHAPQVTGR